MELEFLLLVTLALFSLIAIALTLATWNSTPARRLNLLAETIRYASGMLVNLCILWHTWSDGSDYSPYMGTVSLQTLLLCFAILLSLLHIYDMERLNKMAVRMM